MRQQFSDIYSNNSWDFGSGEGSLPIHTRGYVRFLARFLKDHNVRSVVDFGCGDWQFSRFIDWTGIDYTGLDIVPQVIQNNEAEFRRDNIRFRLFDGDLANIPGADLLIVKDVLQHWPNQEVAEFLNILDRFPLALVTNCVNPGGNTVNDNTGIGGFRYLDPRLAPFHLEAEEVFTFTHHRPLWERLFKTPRWRKKVLLHRN
jgi:SAM-dependent methyltransferase